MKKTILFLIISFCTVAYSQNNDKATTALKAPYSGDNVLWHSYQKTLEGLRVIVVADSAISSPRIFYADSLVNKDTSIYNFNYLYDVGEITVYDSSSTSADTVVIEGYSVTKGAWTSNGIGMRDVNTDGLETNNAVIVIPAGYTKKWVINELRPGQFRVRTISTRSRVLKIGFTGVNP